jgi:hypothetical protein
MWASVTLIHIQAYLTCAQGKILLKPQAHISLNHCAEYLASLPNFCELHASLPELIIVLEISLVIRDVCFTGNSLTWYMVHFCLFDLWIFTVLRNAPPWLKLKQQQLRSKDRYGKWSCRIPVCDYLFLCQSLLMIMKVTRHMTDPPPSPPWKRCSKGSNILGPSADSI